MPNPRVFFDININDKPTGRIEMELFSDTTPLTAENFRALCTGETGFGISRKPLHYKGSTFHRVKPGSWCQGGDITVGDGSGGESIYGARFDNENYINKHTGMGILSMVNHNGTSCNKSQFIICTANTSWLDGKCVAFGKVVKGFDVLKAMENVGSVSGKTSVPVVIADCGQLSLSPTQSMKEIKQVISNFNQGVSIKLKRSREEFKHTWVDNVELLDTASPEKIKEATHDSMMEVEEVLELEENVKQYLKHLSEMKKELCLYEKELLDTQTKIKNITVRNLFVDAIPSMSYEELSVIEKVIKKLKTGNP